MDPKEDDNISIDFSRIKAFFRKKEENKEKKTVEASSNAENQEQKDEDISIDFSKIKNFFKGSGRSKETHEAPKASEDEELSIDFSKVKSFFKSPDKKQDIHETAETSKDDDLSIDFSRVKNIFKSSKDESKSDEFDFDWSKAKNFFVKYGIVFLALIPIILSIYVRMQAGSLGFTDDWASNTVMNGIQSQISGDINQQFPNLPDANRQALVDNEMQKFISQNKDQIDNTIVSYSQSFKSFFQYDDGTNYMPDIDPYYWVRYAENIQEHGYPGDILKDGKSYDDHQLAPAGRFVTPDMFHAYSIYYFYNIVSLIIPSITLFRSSFYLPVFISALSVLIVFLIGRKISGNMGGFFAGMMMAVNTAFLGRTLFGHVDNDLWVIFFPLAITWLFVISIDMKSIYKILMTAGLAGLMTGMFSFTWNGWWFIFDFMIITILLTLSYLLLANFSEIRLNISKVLSNITIRDVLIFFIIYFISSAVFVTLFSSWAAFSNFLLGPLGFPSIKSPVTTPALWPNVLTTVAELNEGSISSIINSVGGAFVFFLSLIGLVLAMSRKDGMKKSDFYYFIGASIFYGLYFLMKKIGINIGVIGLIVWIMIPIALRIMISIYNKDRSYDFKLSILLALWIISTIYASIKGIRFTLLLAPAFSVAFGVALGKIYLYSSRLMTKELKLHKIIAASVMIILLMYVYVAPTRAAIGSARSDIPIVNDVWYNTLTGIKGDSEENAIITSWWDFGHHFKYIADRPVTFDGTTQIFPAAHWVGKMLMSGDEREAIGILRMLNCGNLNGFEAINKVYNDTHRSLKVLNEIMMLDKAEADQRLTKLNVGKDSRVEILTLTHCTPPESYFIASEDMIGKSGVWAHFGSWNFERADIWKNARSMPEDKAVKYMADKFNYTEESAENIYFEMQSISSDSEANAWIAPWPGYGGNVGCPKNNEGVYVCSNGLQVDLENLDIYGTNENGKVRPRSAAFVTESGMIKKEFNGTTLDLGITIINRGENDVEAVLSSRELTGSMFTRMFYTQGHGFRYFKLFDHQSGLTGANIYTYKVDWKGSNVTIVDKFAKKKIAEENAEPLIELAETNLSSNNS